MITDAGMEYFVPNNAVVQGSVRLIKEGVAIEDQLPFDEGDHIELASSSTNRYVGTVSKIHQAIQQVYNGSAASPEDALDLAAAKSAESLGW